MGPARWRVEHTLPRCGFRLCLRDGGGTRCGMWSEMPPHIVFGHVQGTMVVVDMATNEPVGFERNTLFCCVSCTPVFPDLHPPLPHCCGYAAPLLLLWSMVLAMTWQGVWMPKSPNEGRGKERLGLGGARST